MTSVWIALASHALSRRWPHIPRAQLDEVASELHGQEVMRALEPADAVALWLRPVSTGLPARVEADARFAA